MATEELPLSRLLDETGSPTVCMLGLHQVCIKFAKYMYSMHPNFMLGMDFGPNFMLGLDAWFEFHKVCRPWQAQPQGSNLGLSDSPGARATRVGPGPVARASILILPVPQGICDLSISLGLSTTARVTCCLLHHVCPAVAAVASSGCRGGRAAWASRGGKIEMPQGLLTGKGISGFMRIWLVVLTENFILIEFEFVYLYLLFF